MKKLLLFITLLPSLSFSQTFVQIAASGNIFNNTGLRTRLWYDPSLNSVTYTFRGDTTTAPSMDYVYSVDSGNTWSTRHFLFNPPPIAGSCQGVIYNLSGNTNPLNAFVTGFGQSLGNSIIGTAQLGTSTHNQHLAANSSSIAPSCMQTIKDSGFVWVEMLHPANMNYGDTIDLYKGVFNSTAKDFFYTKTSFHAPMDTDATVGKLFVTTTMAWNDNGMIGYVVLIGNSTYQSVGDARYYPIIYKTSDGGTTWTLVTNSSTLDIDYVDPLLLNNGSQYCIGFECDAVVDMNDNLHLIVPIGKRSTPFTKSSISGEWGIFDIYTNNGGTTWFAELLAKPQSDIAQFGVTGSTTDPSFTEGPRPQASRSWIGDKIVFSWFDTDTISFNYLGNEFPNMITKGLDLNTNLWSVVQNQTVGTNIEAFCTFSDASYYLKSNGGNDCVPVVYAQLASSQQTGSPVALSYFDFGCVSNYSNPGNPVGLRLTSVEDINHSSVFSLTVFPNPAHTQAEIQISSNLPSTASVALLNTLGELMWQMDPAPLSAGANKINIDCSSFPNGIYFLKVTTANQTQVRKIIIG